MLCVTKVDLDWYEGQEKVDLSDYVSSGTWDIIGCPGSNKMAVGSDGYRHAWITFTLKIRRKTLFYTVNLIIPCVLISFLSVCVFYLPADAGEKMTMCISILLALVVFLLLVSKILPPTSINVPLIAKYLLFTFLMNILTIVLAVAITNRNFRTPRTHTMPRWVRAVFLDVLPRLLLMRRPHHDDRCAALKTYNRRNYRSSSPTARLSLTAQPRLSLVQQRPSTAAGSAFEMSSLGLDYEDRCSWSQKCRHDGRVVDDEMEKDDSLTLTAETREAVAAVKFIASHLKQEDDFAEVNFTQFRIIIISLTLNA